MSRPKKRVPAHEKQTPWGPERGTAPNGCRRSGLGQSEPAATPLVAAERVLFGANSLELRRENDRLGRLVSPAGVASGGSDRPEDRVGFADVAPGRDVRASVGWFVAVNEERPPDTEASCGQGPRPRLGAVRPG